MFGITRLKLTQPPANKERVLELRVAGWFGRFMSKKNWAGLTTPLPFVNVICYWIGENMLEVNPIVRVHEWFHVDQIEKEGFFLKFWCKYAVETWRFGYRQNRFERDAYDRTQALVEAGAIPSWADSI